MGAIQTAQQLRARAKELGLQTYAGTVKQPLLSDHVIAEFGREWLQAVLPKLAEKPKGQMFNPIDGVLYCYTNASNTVAYLLATSVLFDCPDQAMSALKESNAAESEIKLRKVVKINEAELIKHYAATGGDYRATAEQYPKINDFNVRNRLQSLGLPNFGGRTRAKLRLAAAAFYLEEKSLIESAVIYGVPLQQLESLVRNTGNGFVKVLSMMQDTEIRTFSKTLQSLPVICQK